MDIHFAEPSQTITQGWLVAEEVEGFATPAELAQQFRLRVGDRPVVRSLPALYEKRGATLPPDIAALHGDTYVVTHGVGVVATSKPRRVELVRYTARFEEPGATIDLMPCTAFRELISADLSFEAGLGADGHVKAAAEVGEVGPIIENLGAGAELKLGGGAHVVGKLTLSVKTARIQAVGQSAAEASWQFHRDDTPLVGDQVMVQTVVVPKGQKKLTYTLRALAMIKPGLFSRDVPIETDPLKVVVDLAG